LKRLLCGHPGWGALLMLLAAAPVLCLDSNRSLTQYMHRIWQSPQGLPPATVRSIIQSRDGYVWLGTDRGLVRFDGVRFTVLPDLTAPGAEEPRIRQIYQDPAGDFWIATANAGLLRLRDRVVTRYLPSNAVNCVVPDGHGGLWICTDSGFARFNGGQIDKITSDSVAAACVRKDGSVWFGGAGGELSIWDGKKLSSYQLHSLPGYATVQSLLAAKDDSLWIGTSDGLIHVVNGNQQRFTKEDGLANNSVFTLAESQDGSIWIGTNDGFSRFRGREMESFGTRNGLSQSTVYALFEDREGSLWVGTKRGLNQFLDRRTIPITASEGLPSNDTGPVLQDVAGNIWVGTLGAGLGKYAGRRSSILTKKDGLSSDSIYALAVDGRGGVWVGTDKGLDFIRDGAIVRRYTKSQGLPSNSILSLLYSRDDTLWIGTSAGAAVLRDGRVILLAPTQSRPGIVALGEAGGRVFAAEASTCVRVFSERTLQELPDQALPLRDVDAFYRDEDGFLWMGTPGSGLYLQDGAKLVHFSSNDGLFDDDIYGIAGDDRGQLWMACSKGIFSVYRADLHKFAAGAKHKFDSNPYSPLDGLQTVECKSGVQPAAWRMRNGHISFSTIRGLLVIDPSQVDPKVGPPPVVIESVTVDGRSGRPRQMLDLAPGERNLAFTYTGLSFRWPTRVTFRYKLEGFDRDWIDAGTRREAFYTNLPPRSYRFRVIGCNPDGVCNEAGASESFVLPARFYQRPWFWLLCAVLAGSLVRLGFGLRIQHLKQQFGIVLAERSRIARELHDTLIQGFSGVTMQMQALAARLSPEYKRRLEDIIEDSAGCLREARRSVADLRNNSLPESGLSAAIANAARQSIGPSGARLKLNLEPVQGNLPADVEYNLVRIAQEAVTNSVKHSGARTIEVVLAATQDSVRLAVQDDGSGFVRAGEPAGNHYGLVGMQERARDIGAVFQVASELGAGTTVSVALPIRRTRDGISPWSVSQSWKPEL
jgi:ligand-binding sensor domain-containing protein